MIRRIMGVLFLIMGVVGIIIAYQGLKVTNQFIDNMATSMDNTLQIAIDTLDNVQSTLLVANQSISDLGTTLATVETTAGNVSTSIEDSSPMLDDISQVVTQDVPDSIESIQVAIPALVEVASVIDGTLNTLSRFEIDQTIPIVNYKIQYDLGIEYDPDVPFDVAISNIGASLDGVPETLRGLETGLDTTQQSLAIVTTDLDQLATDMATLNSTIQELDPVFGEYVRITTDINDRLKVAQGGIDGQIAQVKQIFNVIFLWMGLLMLIPFYLGLEMVAGERGISQYVTEKEFAERMEVLKEEWAQANGVTLVEPVVVEETIIMPDPDMEADAPEED